jgi:hypothetical protein
MGQGLYGSATTTEAVRRAIQHSRESLRALAKRYGVNPKTVAKRKARSSVSDLIDFRSPFIDDSSRRLEMTSATTIRVGRPFLLTQWSCAARAGLASSN